MRNTYGADWAFGIKGAIENIVRANYPVELRNWPFLQCFNFEAYEIENSYAVFILKDKLCEALYLWKNNELFLKYCFAFRAVVGRCLDYHVADTPKTRIYYLHIHKAIIFHHCHLFCYQISRMANYVLGSYVFSYGSQPDFDFFNMGGGNRKK